MTARATLQTALVALDSRNGHILAMVGGRDFQDSKWNRATQMARQPGSAFKAIVYTTAIENQYPPCFQRLNQPMVLIMPDGSRWDPKNYDGSTGGPTTLRDALRRSLNLVSVRLVQEVIPPQAIVDYAKQFGISTEINPYPSIALGADVVIPIELTSAFSVFANHGVWAKPTAILRVEDKAGNILEEATPRNRDVIREEVAYIMTDMLSGILEPGGTGQAARYAYGFYRPAAGKTGTTNDFTDAWFLGFTPQITAGVWVGFDDITVKLGDKQSGAVAALPIWAPFMRMVHDTLQLPLADFEMPEGVVKLKICSESKQLATDYCPEVWEEMFTEDMAPTTECEVHTKSPGSRNRRRIY
jgi:penicillin-binding protein 1A